MSYCRWSTNDFQCDIYCYEYVYGGYTTHVAGNRVIFPEPLPPAIPWPEPGAPKDVIEKWSVEYSARQTAVMETIRKAERTPIELPYVGETFNDPDLESFLARLLELKRVGYIFPDDVIETVREELAEEKANPALRAEREEQYRKNIKDDLSPPKKEGNSDEQK